VTAKMTGVDRSPMRRAAAALSAPGLAALAFGAGAICHAQTANRPSPGDDVGFGARNGPGHGAPVVVEMFMSQSCKSCPPAADYLTELADREDLVAFAWHVDYWNIFANRNTGRWQDPFSRASYAERQRQYNRNIRSRSTVFTPQAVIGGILSSVGSKREDVENHIVQAQFLDEKASPLPLTLEVTSQSAESFRVRVKGVPTAYDVLLISFYQNAVTDIQGGDNAGIQFAEAHVVDGMEVLASAAEGVRRFSIPARKADMGCAILVQEPDQGRIIAARYCPDARPLTP